MPVGQNQKAAVVSNQCESSLLRAKIPPDPAIPHPAFQGRAREAQWRHPLVAPRGDVPHRFTNLRECAQIVVTRQLFLIARFFVSFDGLHVKFKERIAGPFRRLHAAA